MNVHEFGTYENGEKAKIIRLKNSHVEAEFVSHGASLHKLILQLPNGTRNVSLGLPDLESYISHGSHVGAIAGRYAGRISYGRAHIDDNIIQLSTNAGEHHVHGGVQGLGRRNWELVDVNPTSVTFSITSTEGDEGYPGNMEIFCTYSLLEFGLRIELTATSSADTPLNLLAHGYFNLDGNAGTINNHLLHIETQKIIERDSTGTPNGKLAKFKNFSDLTEVTARKDYDSTYVLTNNPRSELERAATLIAGKRDLQMEVWTTETQLHFYDGGKLNIQHPSTKEVLLTLYQGLCLEPCRYTVTNEERSLGFYILDSSQNYRQITEYKFFNI